MMCGAPSSILMLPHVVLIYKVKQKIKVHDHVLIVPHPLGVVV